MSDQVALQQATSPWLSAEIDHKLRHDGANFHLRVDVKIYCLRTVVFGPSGSGKSSLLRAIAGLFAPEAGTIAIRGTTVWRNKQDRRKNFSVPADRRRVGLIMQSPAVFPHLSVAGNVAFALTGMEKSARDEKVYGLLQTVDAEALASRWPRQLSGGQLQRVAIARTLAAEPSILLLDEPFSALDAKSRQQLSESVYEWAHARSVPVLTVTHNLEEAFAAGDEVLVMNNGSIAVQGSPAEVLAEERKRLLRAMGVASENYPVT